MRAQGLFRRRFAGLRYDVCDQPVVANDGRDRRYLRMLCQPCLDRMQLGAHPLFAYLVHIPHGPS
jgi:hypothetical protein